MDKNKILSLTGLAVFVILIAVLIWWLVTKDDKDNITPAVDAEWVAVGNNGSGEDVGNILYSSDGKTWEVSDSTGAFFGDNGTGIAYGTSNGTSQLWVAVGDNSGGIGGRGTGNILWSEDGKTWEVSESTGASFGNYGAGIAYGTSDGNSDSQLWVAAGDNGPGAGNILYSSDGKTWEVSDSTGASFGNYGTGVAYGTSDGTSQLWVAAGDNFGGIGGRGTGNILWSEDGKTWTQSDSTGASFLLCGRGVAYGTSDGNSDSQLWVAVGKNDTSAGGGAGICAGNILYSSDGKTWYQSDDGGAFGYYGFGIAYGTSNGTSQLWVAVGDNLGGIGGRGSGNILYSENGKTWTQSDSTGASFANYVYGVAYGTLDGTPLWVAVGEGTHEILYSTNGKKWNVSEDGAFVNYGRSVAAKHLLYGMSPDYYHS